MLAHCGAERHMIMRGVSGRVIDVARETREELRYRLPAGADAREPTLAGASGSGSHILGAAKGRDGTSGRGAERCRARRRQRSSAGRGSVASRWGWHRVVRIPNLPRVPGAQSSRGAPSRQAANPANIVGWQRRSGTMLLTNRRTCQQFSWPVDDRIRASNPLRSTR